MRGGGGGCGDGGDGVIRNIGWDSGGMRHLRAI
jgi:hypothetical protein